MKAVLIILCVLLLFIAAIFAGMLALGPGNPPPPLASISKPFETVDFSDLPAVQHISTPENTRIAYRVWQPKPPLPKIKQAVIAIHGSSASSISMHPLAKALSEAGVSVYAIDIRGHGETGERGDIDYAGQLDDDMAHFARAIRERHPDARLSLLGFSSGGGFALHIAALPLGKMFKKTVLLSPMLGVDAPTVKPGGDEWARPAIPRIIALRLLNRLGIHAFDGLPVLAFAIQPDRAEYLTDQYSFRLMKAFATDDYISDLRNATPPLAVLAGSEDELFAAEQFAPAIRSVQTDSPVTIIPGLNHIDMISDPRAVPPILSALRQ